MQRMGSWTDCLTQEPAEKTKKFMKKLARDEREQATGRTTEHRTRIKFGNGNAELRLV